VASYPSVPLGFNDDLVRFRFSPDTKSQFNAFQRDEEEVGGNLMISEIVGQGRVWTVYNGQLAVQRPSIDSRSPPSTHRAHLGSISGSLLGSIRPVWDEKCWNPNIAAVGHQTPQHSFLSSPTIGIGSLTSDPSMESADSMVVLTTPSSGSKSSFYHWDLIPGVVKIVVPMLIDDRNLDLDAEGAVQAAKHEALLYENTLAHLQSTVIPRYYGLFTSPVSSAVVANATAWVMVIEKMGPSLSMDSWEDLHALQR
jgi:hypothetical protein